MKLFVLCLFCLAAATRAAAFQCFHMDTSPTRLPALRTRTAMRKTASHVVNVNPLSGSVQLFTAEFVIMTPHVAVRSRTVRYVECQKER